MLALIRKHNLSVSMLVILTITVTSVSCSGRDDNIGDESASKSVPPPAAGAAPASRNPGQPSVIDDAAIADESRVADWLAYGGTHYERRFSPLSDINVANVANLKADWYLDLPRDVGLVSTPLVVDGVMHYKK